MSAPGTPAFRSATGRHIVPAAFSGEASRMKPVSGEELTQAIADALWRNWHLRMKRRSLDDAKLWEGAVTRHLRLCEWEVTQPPPKALHKSPD